MSNLIHLSGESEHKCYDIDLHDVPATWKLEQGDRVIYLCSACKRLAFN